MNNNNDYTPSWKGCQIITGLPLSIKFAGTHLYTWVERGTVRVKCLSQEHNTMSLARARARTARSGVERTNHGATTPPTRNVLKVGQKSVQWYLLSRFYFSECCHISEYQ